MYLKALEIQGFKSFPQKTSLTFEKDITAIVGPNGSGKSNISDALRWVMGEQSTKALRGGKMEDVIFGGTEKRAPQGFAEVSLILNNSDNIFDIEAAEVMVTRRYYRSGDSEYYINKKSCRLRDVNELFMDTGLGREGYSIIGQGRIDEILSVKSTDRRNVFEEAAGISRFRHRKEESQHKLQLAEDNLLRINDKVSELELQVEPLRRQSETAKKYLVLRDELREREISVWIENLEQYDAEAEKHEADLNTVTAEKDGAQRDIDDYYRRSEETAEKIRQKDIESENIRNSMNELSEKRGQSENAAAVLRATAKANEENAERIKGELAGQEGRSRTVSEQIEQYGARKLEIADERKAIKSDLAGLEKIIAKLSEDTSQNSRALSDLMSRENELTVRQTALASQISFISDSEKSERERLESANRELTDADNRLNASKNELKNTEDNLNAKNDELNSVINRIRGYEMRLNSRRQRAESLDKELAKLNGDYASLNSRISLLSEMEKEYAGYSRAVKLVMQEAGRGLLRGVCGTVGGLIKADEDYTLAIETALGAALGNIIVEKDEDGKAGINFLKRRDGGRATFMPVQTIKGTVLRENLDREHGFEGIASELVSCDDKYRDICRYLLGRTVVAETLDDAVKIGRKYQNKFRIVTLDGQTVNAGGSMTGGSASKNAGILSRANELKKLEKTKARMQRDIGLAEQAAAGAHRELDGAAGEYEIAQTERRELEDEVLRLSTALEHLKTVTATIEQAKNELAAQAAAVSGNIAKSKQTAAEGEKKLADINAQLEEVKKLADEKSRGGEETAQLINDNRQKRDELLLRDASLDAELRAIDGSVAELRRILSEMADGSRRQYDLIEHLKKENEEILSTIRRHEAEAEKSAELYEKLRRTLTEKGEEKLALEGERSRRDRELQGMNERILNLEREISRLEQLKISAQMNAKQIIDKLWDTYELTRSEAAQRAEKVEDMPDMQRQIAQLRREISSLGTPNIGAIEEFERVNARYTYLVEQREDIEKSKSELDGIISDITSEMQEIFAVKFAEIDKAFRETFTELFGGGRASLELEDEEDILNCGIEIKVQPPGKSLKTLTLLSGGEKAFVAIALYFAILKVRPTPFVIMDEIESALDEVNNGRFAEYMRRLTPQTQFLVITHRRRTMEEADVLYGVTMQEKGVSRVLDIDISEAEKTILR